MQHSTNQPKEVLGKDIHLFQQTIRDHSAYDFSDYSHTSLRRRLIRLLLEYETDIEGLTRRMRSDPSFMEQIIRKLTVHTTELFRDPDVWIRIGRDLLPNYKDKQRIRIWHPGCSTGQEVYSMMMLLDSQGLLEKTDIYGTDINPDVMDTARTGTYKYRFNQSYVENFRKVILGVKGQREVGGIGGVGGGERIGAVESEGRERAEGGIEGEGISDELEEAQLEESALTTLAENLPTDPASFRDQATQRKSSRSSNDKKLYKKYFHIDKASDVIRMTNFLRSKPVWKTMDLVKDSNPFLVKFDLIICRNVIIYFNNELQNRVFDLFYKNMNDYGALVLGVHETILGPYTKRFAKRGEFYLKGSS